MVRRAHGISLGWVIAAVLCLGMAGASRIGGGSRATAAVLGSGMVDLGSETLVEPFRSTQQTLLPFGERSHWLQPWRGYLQTVPARRLVNALGIVFNPAASQAEKVAAELAAAGFHRARLEISWCKVAYGQPGRLTDTTWLRTMLSALRRNHLRPLILLNANEGCPGPLRHVEIHVVAPAHAGERQLTLDSSSIGQVVPGRTGLDSATQYKAAAFLFTAVSGDTVTLSKPLEHNLAAGRYPASTLEYAPFGRPGDPSFQRTMTGWLRYVATVTRTVKRLIASEQFDVEVWNELSFGSDFLDIDAYYDPPIVSGPVTATERALLQQTVEYIRNPSHGVSRIGIGDGFANERPWEAGSTAPAGLTAIDKHPYVNRRTFPADSPFSGVRPVNALGQPEGVRDAQGNWHDSFIPHYTSFFPEYFLTGIQTETVIRDLSPITTTIYGTPHGRSTHPRGSPPPAVWLTEAGLDPAGIPASVLPRLHAKAALRWAASWINKGASALYYYAVSQRGWALVDPDAPGGGQTLTAIGHLTHTLESGAEPISQHRTLGLTSVSGGDHVQFVGDGTAAHPSLHDRDVLGFFPFQVSNRRVVVATYVMTRDMLHPYRPKLAATDPRRYDLPPEWFRLTITGVFGLGRHVTSIDPLSGHQAAVHVVSRSRNRLVVDVALTDSPHLLVLG